MAEGNSNKSLIVFLIVLPFLVIAGLATAIIFTKGNIFAPTKEEKVKKKVEDFDNVDLMYQDEEDIIPNYVDDLPNFETITLENITINPKMDSVKKGRMRILALKIGLQIKPIAIGKEEITSKEIMIRDSINYYLATKDVGFLANTTNRDVMKERIKSMTNDILKKSRVMKITFPTYIIQ
jgi:flagellar basal body-associated protein FliL